MCLRVENLEPTTKYSQLMMDPRTLMVPRTASYWVAQYESTGDAEDACKAIQKLSFAGRKLNAYLLDDRVAHRVIHHPLLDIQQASKEGNVIALGNLPEDTSVNELKSVFAGMSLDTQPISLGHPLEDTSMRACVHFRSNQEAHRALREMYGTQIRGMRMQMRLVE